MYKKSAFTLLELIVVLVILFIFIGFVLSNFYTRPFPAYNIICQTNLKGYGNAYIMYLDDHDQLFPDTRTWLFNNPNTSSPQCLWHDRLQNLVNNPNNEGPFFKYVADKNNHVCQKFDKLAQSGLGEQHPGHNPAIPIESLYMYSMNAYLGPGPHGLVKKLGDIETDTSRVVSFTEQNIMWNVKKQNRYNPDINPFMFLTRTDPYQPEDYASAFATYHLAPADDIEIDPANSTATQDATNYPDWGLTRGNGNAVFLDQHVESMPFWKNAHEYTYPLKNPITRPTDYWPNLDKYYRE